MKKRRLLYVSAANFTLVEQLVHTIFTGDYSYSTCGLCYNTMLSAQAFDFCILLLRTRDVNLGSWSHIENNQSWESRFATLVFYFFILDNEIYILPNIRDSFNKVIFIVIFCHYSSRSVLVSPIINIILCPIFFIHFLFHPFFHILLPLN
jgi:hypothetical protein